MTVLGHLPVVLESKLVGAPDIQRESGLAKVVQADICRARVTLECLLLAVE